MSEPTRVQGFLDFFGDWDPSLMIVMLGAIGVHWPLYRWIRRASHPRYCTQFYVPEAGAIDARLMVGSILFGLGWGLEGFCPGPALASLLVSREALLALLGVVVGIVLVDHLWPRAMGLVRRGSSCDHGRCGSPEQRGGASSEETASALRVG